MDKIIYIGLVAILLLMIAIYKKICVPNMIYIGIIILLIIVFALFNKTSIIKDTELQREKERIVKTLIRQGSRWATAAEQDMSPLIATVHANYGAGYLWALKDILSQNEIEKYGGIDLMKYEREILKIQDKTTMNNAKLCPGYAPERTYLTSLGGEG
jgi:hypothetical protein